MAAYCKVKSIFENTGGNYKFANVFDNNLFSSEQAGCVMLKDVRDCGGLDNIYQLAQLKYEDFFEGNRFKRCVDIENSTGTTLGYNTYMTVRSALLLFKNRKARSRILTDSDMSFSAFIGNSKKPVKRIKLLLNSVKKRACNLEQHQTVKSFFRITDMVYVGNDFYSKVISLWSTCSISCRLSSFIFKYFNNTLGLNTRVSHFGNNVSRNCTFCAGEGRPATDETFLHLFVECPTTSCWANNFNQEYLGGNVLPNADSRRNFWILGKVIGDDSCDTVRVIVILVFQYMVWEHKLSKNIPSFRTFMCGYLELLNQTIYSNRKWKNLLELTYPYLYRALAAR
jgi:hypothetical protein